MLLHLTARGRTHRELVAEAGHFSQALHWTGSGGVKSPLYDSLEEAKGGCETYRHVGAFPEKEERRWRVGG